MTAQGLSGGKRPEVARSAGTTFCFRILEFDLVQRAWIGYAVEKSLITDGYGIRAKRDQLNFDYVDHGRKFKVQRRELSPWEDVA